VALELGGSPANPRVALFNLRAGPEPKPLWCTRWKSSTWLGLGSSGSGWGWGWGSGWGWGWGWGSGSG